MPNKQYFDYLLPVKKAPGISDSTRAAIVHWWPRWPEGDAANM